MKRPDPHTLEAQIACVRREVGLRERVYPRWQQLGRIDADKAENEIATMKALLARLEGLQEEERPKLL